jgi:hypothetical protein
MVKHIVMFKLKEKNAENMEAAVSILRGLDGKIKSLIFIEVGVDSQETERSYDLVLTTHFDDQEGLSAYASHPTHLPVIETMRNLCSNSIVVDYVTE